MKVLTKRLNKALSFAKNFSKISLNEERIVLYSCSSILTDIQGNIWTKTGNDLFDVHMGSYIGEGGQKCVT